MENPPINRLIHPLAVATVAATLLLIFMGGLVTSHQAGMSVPDWPNSYGYNMFAFPISQWRGGIFYEHTHRLMGSLVGFTSLLMCLHAWGWPKNFKLLARFGLTVLGLISILGLWAAIAPHGSFTAAAVAKYGFEFVALLAVIGAYAWFCRQADERRWIRGLSLAVLLSVLFQGLLGGMRVVLVNLDLAIVHACVAQAFLCLVTLLAIVSARQKMAERSRDDGKFMGRSHHNAAFSDPLSPVPGGEGQKARASSNSYLRESEEKPLSPTVSPDYRGEGYRKLAMRSHRDAAFSDTLSPVPGGEGEAKLAMRSHRDTAFSNPLSPVPGGEGQGEGPSAASGEDLASRRMPLTPALSPEYEGEGEAKLAMRSHRDAAFSNPLSPVPGGDGEAKLAMRSHRDAASFVPLSPVPGGEGQGEGPSAASGEDFAFRRTPASLEYQRNSKANLANRSQRFVSPALRTLIGITLLAIYAQLIIGATMRHFQAGLAIPDLPLAYHHVLPPTDSAQLADANTARAFGQFGAPLPPVTLPQIWLHFAHRCGAVVVTCLLGSTVMWILLKINLPTLRTLAWTLAALLLSQLTLGVLTVLWRKPADIASTHVVVGAATLMTTFILYVRARPFVLSPARSHRTAAIEFPELSAVSA